MTRRIVQAERALGWTLACLVIASLQLNACRSSSDAAGSLGEGLWSGDTLVVFNLNDLAAAPKFAFPREARIVLGAPESPDDASQYRMLSGPLLLRDGLFAFASDASKQVFIHDASGDQYARVGRQGAGPGEFRHIAILTAATRDTLFLLDILQRRTTAVALDSLSVRVTPVSRSGSERRVPMHRYADGRFLAYVNGEHPSPSRTGIAVLRAELVLVGEDSVRAPRLGSYVWDQAVIRDDPQLGYFFGMPVPFPVVDHVAVSDSLVVIAEAASSEVRVVGLDGSVRRRIRFSGLRRELPEVDRLAAKARAREKMTDAYSSREWELLSADDAFPEQLPAFDQAIVDRGGRLWLREGTPPSATKARWIVLTTAGALIGTLQVDAGLELRDADDERVAAIYRDTFGGEQVRIYGFAMP